MRVACDEDFCPFWNFNFSVSVGDEDGAGINLSGECQWGKGKGAVFIESVRVTPHSLNRVEEYIIRVGTEIPYGDNSFRAEVSLGFPYSFHRIPIAVYI